MAKHIHVHIHRAPTRDRAPVARAVRSIGRDQHAPEDVSQLVGVLMQIIAGQGGKTQDAEFDESKHKRDEGGKFTAGGMNAEQHQAAAAAKRQKGEEALKASDTQSAVKHITESQAHEDVSRALGAADMSSASPGGDYKQHLNQAASHFARTAAPAQAAPAQGEKPTSTTAKGARAATHELLSSGHPFSVDELCKATGAPKSTITTVLSDLKNPKYAGKLGTLEIVKRPDGMYHVQKKEGAGLAPKHVQHAETEQQAKGMSNRAPGGAAPAPTPATKKPHAAGVSAGFSVSRELANLRSQGVDVSGVEQLTGTRQRQAINSLLEARAASPDPLMHAAVAENPRTTEVRHASGTGQSFLPSVKTSGAGAPPAAPLGSASGVPGWDAKKAAALKNNMETLRGRYEVAREKRKARGEHTQSLVEMKARSAYERADREHTSYSFPSKASQGK